MKLAQVTPPLFAMQVCRVDTAAHNTGLPHFTDGKFFRDHPRRKAHLRICWPDEFDKHIPDQYKVVLPRMYALVTELSEGTHIVLPVFRTNRPFWTEPRTDAEVASVVAEMGRLGGSNFEEMLAFVAEHCDESEDSITGSSGTSTVH